MAMQRLGEISEDLVIGAVILYWKLPSSDVIPETVTAGSTPEVFG